MNIIEYLLTKLAEEGAEVTKECTKAMTFGLNDVNPLEPGGPNNGTKLIDELNDLLGIAAMLVSFGILPRDWQSKAKQDAKIAKVRTWMQYSREKGTLHDESCQGSGFHYFPCRTSPRIVATHACGECRGSGKKQPPKPGYLKP